MRMLTISENVFGHYHIWFGRKRVSTNNPANHKVKGEDSPVYLQFSDEIEILETYLTTAQLRDLSHGYTVCTYRVPVEYFEHEYNLYLTEYYPHLKR